MKAGGERFLVGARLDVYRRRLRLSAIAANSGEALLITETGNG